jgi:hypothetical protein
VGLLEGQEARVGRPRPIPGDPVARPHHAIEPAAQATVADLGVGLGGEVNELRPGQDRPDDARRQTSLPSARACVISAKHQSDAMELGEQRTMTARQLRRRA